MTYLTDDEISFILQYTGLDTAATTSLEETPVVYFCRNGTVLDFVTIFSTELNKP